MTPESEQLVRDTWKQLGPRADECSRSFYDKLFELDPDARRLFERANLDEQRHRFMETLGQLVAMLDDTERFVSRLVELGRRHFTHGVRDGDYDSAGVALLWALEAALGPAFTPEVRTAWTEAYQAMSAVMRRVGTASSGTHRAV